MSIIMNKRFKFSILIFFIFSVLAFFHALWIPAVKDLNCTGTLSRNSPLRSGYFLRGTVSVKLFSEGEGLISLYGMSSTRAKAAGNIDHMLYRDVYFKFKKKNRSILIISNIKTVKHPLDDMADNEYDEIAFDILNLESNKLHIRQISNAYIFGNQPVPSFICVTKAESDNDN